MAMAARIGSAARPKSASRRQTPAMVALEEIGQIRSEVNRRLYEWDQKMQAQNELLNRILQLLEKREPAGESSPVPSGASESVEPVVESNMFAADATTDSADEDAASDGSARCIGYDFSSGDSDEHSENGDCAETNVESDGILEFADDVPILATVPHFETPRLTCENLSATAQYLDNFQDAHDFAAVFRKNIAPAPPSAPSAPGRFTYMQNFAAVSRENITPALPAVRPLTNTSATTQLLNKFTDAQDFAAVFRKNNNDAQACRLSTNSS